MGYLVCTKVALDSNIVLADAGGCLAGDLIETNLSVAEATEGGLGVAMSSGDNGDTIPLLLIGVCELTGGAAIAAGADIEFAATNKYITKSAGVKVGKALTACTGNGYKFMALINVS